MISRKRRCGMPDSCLRFSGLAVVFCCIITLLGSSLPALAISTAEETRINRLLAALSIREDLVFIRNDSEHTAAEAVDHLRLKWRRAGNRIATAEQFIEYLATASSISKKPYLIRQPGASPEPAGPFLSNLLRELDSTQ